MQNCSQIFWFLLTAKTLQIESLGTWEVLEMSLELVVTSSWEDQRIPLFAFHLLGNLRELTALLGASASPAIKWVQ